jgi:hypothetical protein
VKSTSTCARTTNATVTVALRRSTRRDVLRLACAIACRGLIAFPRAQEGHPLVGTWHGTWGPTAAERHDVTLVLEFDGKAITGMMNPGPDSIRFDKVTLDPSTWSVHFEATPKGGKAAPIVIDATIQDVTNRRRSLVGTWRQGSAKGDFKAARDD